MVTIRVEVVDGVGINSVEHNAYCTRAAHFQNGRETLEHGAGRLPSANDGNGCAELLRQHARIRQQQDWRAVRDDQVVFAGKRREQLIELSGFKQLCGSDRLGACGEQRQGRQGAMRINAGQRPSPCRCRTSLSPGEQGRSKKSCKMRLAHIRI